MKSGELEKVIKLKKQNRKNSMSATSAPQFSTPTKKE